MKLKSWNYKYYRQLVLSDENTRVGVLPFSSAAKKMINFSTDSGEIISQIQHLQTDNEGWFFKYLLRLKEFYNFGTQYFDLNRFFIC